MRVTRAVTALTGSVIMVSFVVAGLAWACTPQARIVGISPGSGPPGSRVNVTGDALPPGGTVEIRWNTLTGERLGTTVADEGGKVAFSVAIPDVAPGVYALVAMAEDGAGVARTAFEVTPATATATNPVPAPASTQWASPSVPTVDAVDRGRGLGVTAASALLAVGLVGVMAAFATAAVSRRRPATAGATKPRS